MKRPWRARPALTSALALLCVLLVAGPALAAFGDRKLSRGMEGGDVEKLQSILTDLGYETSDTGYFGSVTEDNVKRYERDEDKRVDGVVPGGQAEEMKARANAGEPKAEPEDSNYSYGERKLQYGDRGEDVEKLQRLLTKLGLETEVTGDFDSATEESVRRDERNESLRENGSVSPEHAADIERRAELRSAGEEEAGGDGRKHVFPIDGPHDYGSSASRFGAARGGRSHRGQDIFAKSGTPIRAVHDGKVSTRQFQASGAGNYVVIRGDDGQDSVYMHMLEPASVRAGDRVDAGERLGKVGCTGSCTGSHLHFELWTPHWYDGGAPFDPLHKLKHWDENS